MMIPPQLDWNRLGSILEIHLVGPRYLSQLDQTNITRYKSRFVECACVLCPVVARTSSNYESSGTAWKMDLNIKVILPPNPNRIGNTCVGKTWQTLQWRHIECDGISNHQPHDCLLNRLSKAQIQENIKAPCHWPFWGEFTGERWIPHTKCQ